MAVIDFEKNLPCPFLREIIFRRDYKINQREIIKEKGDQLKIFVELLCEGFNQYKEITSMNEAKRKETNMSNATQSKKSVGPKKILLHFWTFRGPSPEKFLKFPQRKSFQ